MTKIEIGNFQGILGDVVQSTVEQNLSMKVAKHDFQAVRDALQEIGLEQDDIAGFEETALQKDPEPEKPSEYGARTDRAGWERLCKTSRAEPTSCRLQPLEGSLRSYC